MRAIRLVVALCLLSIPASAESARPFKSATAASVLSACLDKAEWQQGFCLGFIEALAVRLADTRDACTHWPVNIEPLLAEAIDALNQTETTAPAWRVIEQRLSVKHLAPCR